MMNDGIAKKWLGKLTRLNPAAGRGKCQGKAPHKPLLLLCLLDMAEAGELTGRNFTRTAGLVLRFKSYGALVSERWPTRLDLRMPFFYLRTQGFWQAFTLEMTEAQSPETCFACELKEEFFDLLGDADFRLKARLLLVSRYFEPRERLALAVVEHEETRAKTELGAAQKDTARELSAKLASLKGTAGAQWTCAHTTPPAWLQVARHPASWSGCLKSINPHRITIITSPTYHLSVTQLYPFEIWRKHVFNVLVFPRASAGRALVLWPDQPVSDCPACPSTSVGSRPCLPVCNADGHSISGGRLLWGWGETIAGSNGIFFYGDVVSCAVTQRGVRRRAQDLLIAHQAAKLSHDLDNAASSENYFLRIFVLSRQTFLHPGFFLGVRSL